MNRSLPVQFPTQTLVKHRERSPSVGVVDSNTEQAGIIRCWVKWSKNGTPIAHYESQLRRLSLAEFFLFKHPVRGWRVGKNSAWWILITVLFAAIVFACGFTVEDAWRWPVFALPIGMLAIIIIGTIRNYHNKQF